MFVVQDSPLSIQLVFGRPRVRLPDKDPCTIAVVQKLGVNYPPGVIHDSSRANAEPKPHRCSVLWAITAKETFDLKCETFLLRVIRHNRYHDLGNGSNKFGNHCTVVFARESVCLDTCPNHCDLRGLTICISGSNSPIMEVTSCVTEMLVRCAV